MQGKMMILMKNMLCDANSYNLSDEGTTLAERSEFSNSLSKGNIGS